MKVNTEDRFQIDIEIQADHVETPLHKTDQRPGANFDNKMSPFLKSERNNTEQK